MHGPENPSCPVCCDRWYTERRERDRELRNPSRARPDIIRRLWAELARRYADPREWQGVYMTAQSMPPITSCNLRLEPVADAADRADFLYTTQGFATHLVEDVTCEGIRVWERITTL